MELQIRHEGIKEVFRMELQIRHEGIQEEPSEVDMNVDDFRTENKVVQGGPLYFLYRLKITIFSFEYLLI